RRAGLATVSEEPARRTIMHRRLALVHMAAVAISIGFGSRVGADETAHWGYEGATGPREWPRGARVGEGRESGRGPREWPRAARVAERIPGMCRTQPVARRHRQCEQGVWSSYRIPLPGERPSGDQQRPHGHGQLRRGKLHDR